MAYGFVQTTATTVSGSGGTLGITVSATGINNLVVAHVVVLVGETCTGVTDDKGNTYVLSAGVTIGANRTVYQAYGVQVVSGATTITASFSASTVTKILGADEFSGGATSNAAIFDTETTGTGSSTAVAASTLTPAATGELLVASMVVMVATTWTAGTSYTMGAGNGTAAMRSEYRLSGAASETAPATLGASRVWGTILHAYKLPVSALPIAMQYGLQSGQAHALSGTHR